MAFDPTTPLLNAYAALGRIELDRRNNAGQIFPGETTLDSLIGAKLYGLAAHYHPELHDAEIIP